MSKYVCDFDTLKSIATNLKKYASDMTSALTAYEANIQSDLSGWTGTAKEEFVAGSAEQIASAKTYATSIDELSNFITNAVDAIESTESEISSINI